MIYLVALSYIICMAYHYLHLQPVLFKAILQDPMGSLKQLKTIDRIIPHFENYLKKGYYPFAFEDPDSYYEKLSPVIDKTVFEDVANYYNLKTPNLQYFKRVLTYLASIPPGDLNSVELIRSIHPYEVGSSGRHTIPKPSGLFILQAKQELSSSKVSRDI